MTHRVRSAYIPEVQVRMRVGGATNGSLRNIFRQNQEIFRALKKNGVGYSPGDDIVDWVYLEQEAEAQAFGGGG